MNRMTGNGMVWRTTRPSAAPAGANILIPFPGTTVISSSQMIREPKQGK
jgi:hypothetical protein